MKEIIKQFIYGDDRDASGVIQNGWSIGYREALEDVLGQLLSNKLEER